MELGLTDELGGTAWKKAVKPKANSCCQYLLVLSVSLHVFACTHVHASLLSWKSLISHSAFELLSACSLTWAMQESLGEMGLKCS